MGKRRSSMERDKGQEWIAHPGGHLAVGGNSGVGIRRIAM